MGIAGIFWVSVLLVVILNSISGDANRLSNIIYTDKDIYAPGETVSIVVLNVDTLEASNNASRGDADYTLIVSDSKQNIIISESATLRISKPYFVRYITIGANASPGNWNVQLSVKSPRNSSMNTTYRRKFEVRAVRAPRLSIRISPTYNFVDNKNLSIISPNRYNASLTVAVSAVYDSGAAIVGKCRMTVRIIDDCGNGFLPEIFPELTSEFHTEGVLTMHVVDVTPYIANDKHPARKDLRDSGGIFEIVLRVTDKFTGQRVTEVTRTTFSKGGNTIREFSSSRVRRPGLPFMADFRLLDKEGNIVKVDEKYEFRPHSGNSHANFQQGVGSIIVPDSETSYRIGSRKIALIRNIANITHKASDYLQIRLLDMATNEISQNAPFKVQVMSTIPIDTAHIVIYSGGKLIFSETRSPNNSKNFQIESIFPDNSWREATLAVFANASGKFISDAISLTVANWTQKASDNVGLSVSADTAEPGQTIAITLQAKPDSVAYLQIEDIAFEDPDEFASEKWLQTESGGKRVRTDDLVIRDGMSIEEIARVLANKLNEKKETDENPICRDKPKKINSRRQVWASGFTLSFDENNTFTKLVAFPDDEVTWRIKGFVVVKTSEESGRRIEFLPPALVRISRPIKILMELPVSLVENEKLVVPILIPHTAEDPKNVKEVRIVMKHFDANETKIVNCTRISDNSQLKYDCPMQFTHFGRNSVVVEAEVHGDDLKKSSKKFLYVHPLGREKYGIASAVRSALQPANKLEPNTIQATTPGLKCLTSGLEYKPLKENEIPILTVLTDLSAVVGDYMENRLESPLPGGSLQSSLLNLTVYSLWWSDDRTFEVLYQNILTFKREDGSFAEFGEKSTNSSIWLTAWVVQTLVEVGYRTVTVDVIREGLNFLKNRTESCFVGRHPGPSMHLDDAKNDPKDLALAAYVLVTFLKASRFYENNEYNGTIEKAREYLKKNFNSSDASFYAKILIAYSEHVWEEMNPAGRSEKARYIETMLEGPLGKYTPRNKKSPLERILVQFHSYIVLMNYDEQLGIKVHEGKNRIFMFLKSLPGFVTAFETATAFSALAKGAEKEGHHLADYKLSIVVIGRTNSTEMLTRHPYEEYPWRSKRYVLPKGTRQVCIGGIGQGFVTAELGYIYYENLRNISGQFHLAFDTELTNEKDLKMKFSTRDNGTAPSEMAVAEVNLPSGYNFIQPQTNLELRNVSSAKHWDYLNGNSKMEIYFESVPPNVSINFNLFASKKLEVTNLAPAAVRIYEFNNPTDESQVIYEIPGVLI